MSILVRTQKVGAARPQPRVALALLSKQGIFFFDQIGRYVLSSTFSISGLHGGV